MNEQLALIEEALRRSRAASLGGMPLDIAVARQYGDSTVTLRTQVTSPAQVQLRHPAPPRWRAGRRSGLRAAVACGRRSCRAA
jgi:hypothetical protein